MNDKPQICIIGAGRTGRILINRLKHSWDLIVIDNKPEKIKICEKMFSNFHIQFITGDASSFITLKKAHVVKAYQVLITINNDDVIQEIIDLLKKRLQIRNIIARASSERVADKLRKAAIHVVTPYETMANMMINDLSLGETIAINIGKGAGEIMQIELTASSPIVRKKLCDLPPHPWIIGAIYRPQNKIKFDMSESYFKKLQITKEDKLIIPDGNTIPKPGDKIILIGEPEVLQATAQYLKAGAPLFPLRYGNSIISVFQDENICNDHFFQNDFKWLINKLEPARLEYIVSQTSIKKNIDQIEYSAIWKKHISEDPPVISVKKFYKIMDYLNLFKNEQKPGVVIFKKSQKPFFYYMEKFYLLKKTINFCYNNNTPLLILNSSIPFSRISIFVSVSDHMIQLSELAIEVAKNFSLPLEAISINLPAAISGEQVLKNANDLLQSINELSTLHGVQLEKKILTGNPVHETINNINNNELLVIALPVKQNSGFLQPPISEKYLVKKFKGNMLVLTV